MRVFEKETDHSSSKWVYERPYDENTDSGLPNTSIDHRIGKIHSSHLIGKRKVKSREEIQHGDLVEYTFGANPFHTAVCTGIQHSEDLKSEVTLKPYVKHRIVVGEDIINRV